MTPLEVLHEVYPENRRVAVPLGIRVNGTVTALGLRGDASGATSLEDQVAAVFDQMRHLVEGAGGSLDNVGRAVAYVGRAEEREPVNGTWWESVFPDRADRPAYKVLLAELPPGELVRLDVFAVLGQLRRRIDLDNVPARDPTVVIGPYVISSRCHGNDGREGGALVPGGVAAEAAQTFRNLRELVTVAGGSPEDIVQVNTYGRDPDYLQVVERVFEDAFSDLDDPPHLHGLVNFVSPRMSMAADMVAVIGAGARRNR